MSTAGKVLVVLVLLIIPAWVVMIAGVAQINTLGTKELARLKAEVEKLDEQSKALAHDVQALKDSISLEQIARDEQQATLRARIAELDRVRTDVYEANERIKLQLADVKAKQELAETAKDRRTEEVKAEEEGKKAAEDEVTKLQAETSALMNQLTKLREDFKSTLAENRELVEKLQKAAPKAKKTARSASYIR